MKSFEPLWNRLLTAQITAAASVVTIIVFMLFRWSPFSRTYLRSRPWGVLAWVFILTFGTVIPSEWLLEQLNVEMSEPMQHLFEEIMKSPAGYVAIGLLAPLAEEMVFRGAILRVLLKVFDRRWHWLPIAISAVMFGAVHGNIAQFIHASLLGLLLGWLYYRTGSIVPGVVLHWVNNSIAYVLFNLLPQTHRPLQRQSARCMDVAGLLTLHPAPIVVPTGYQDEEN